MKKQKLLISLLAIGQLTSLCTVATSCNNENKDEIYEKLINLDSVVKVDVNENIDIYGKTYIAWFKQPIDWNDESKGYFNQRVQICVLGQHNVNIEGISGYNLSTFKPAGKVTQSELESHFNGNSIRIEYRFYGESRPEGLDNWSTELWQYLTYENALKDFHHINEELQTIFDGKWILTGGSKGGQTTDAYAAMDFADDIDAYVSYVSPMCFENEVPLIPEEEYNALSLDNRVLTSIGDDSAISQDAAEIREELLKLDALLISNADEKISEDDDTTWAEYMLQKATEKGQLFTVYAYQNPSYLLVGAVSELHTAYWQMGYWQDEETRAKIQDIVNNKKIDEAIKYLDETVGYVDYDMNDIIHPYKIQGFTEMGLAMYDFTYWAAKLEELTNDYAEIGDKASNIVSGINLICPEPQFHQKLMLSFNQLNDPWFTTFDDTFMNKMEEWRKNCTSNVIQVYGATDPWTAYRMKEDTETSENIHFFLDPKNPHTSKIKTLPEELQTQAWALLDQWIK